MHALAKPKNWKHLCICSVDFARIVLSNLGVTRRAPDCRKLFDHCAELFGLLWDTRNKLVVRNSANIVEEGAAIYVANHIKKSDALTVVYAVYMNAGGRQLHIMMRDDFFDDRSWSRTPFLDLDKLAMSLGAIQVNRQYGAYSQMKRFIRLLREGGCFIIFPTGTRSRSGHVMGLPPPRELGKASFFAVMAQRERFSRKESSRVEPVAMVPTGMSFDPISEKTTLVFGKPAYLTPDPPDKKVDRAVLSEFDQQLVRSASRLVEVNLAHLGALYLLHWAWHSGALPNRNEHGVGLKRNVFINDLTEIVSDIKKESSLFLAPSLNSELDLELRRVEKLFARQSMLRTVGEELLLYRERILSAPPVDHGYRKRNPVKYLANQVAHLEEVVSAVETRVLRTVRTHH